MTDDNLDEIRDSDRDSMHILPLSILPVETPGLKSARLIKNDRLESVIEMFEDEGTGSGQIDVGSLADEFGWPSTPEHPDFTLMNKLSQLPSYDVYSLRIMLREHGIKVNDFSALKLSDSKVEELTGYMTAFTHPLIAEVFGSDDLAVKDFSDILGMFRDPDIKKARARLIAMSKKLKVQPEDIPRFLERFGDIFLSLSYYRQYLDGVTPVIDGFHESIEELQSNFQLKSDASLMNTCGLMRDTVGDALGGVRERFDEFDRGTNDMWDTLSASKFEDIRNITQNCHTVMSGVLCGLSVKMDAWQERFPNMDSGGPLKRAEFIMQNMRPGLDQIKITGPDTSNSEWAWS